MQRFVAFVAVAQPAPASVPAQAGQREVGPNRHQRDCALRCAVGRHEGDARLDRLLRRIVLDRRVVNEHLTRVRGIWPVINPITLSDLNR